MDKEKIDHWVSLREPPNKDDIDKEVKAFIDEHGEYIVSKIIVGDICWNEQLLDWVQMTDGGKSKVDSIFQICKEIEDTAKDYGLFSVSSFYLSEYEHVSKMNKEQISSLSKEDKELVLKMRKELGFNDSNYTSLIIFSIISALVVLYLVSLLCTH